MENNNSGSIFDKDWQQSRGSRTRLEKISHHFLSEIQPLPATPSGSMFLPIYVEDIEHAQVAKHIADAMTAHCDCTLLNVDRRLQRPEDRTGAEATNKDFNIPLTRKNDLASAEDMLGRLKAGISEQSYIPELGLVALSSQHMALIKRLKRVVIPAVATLDGIRNAYLNIKKLGNNDVSEFSIVMLDSDSQVDSQIYFEKLATGALRFLNLHLMYNGYIPAGIENISGTDKYSSNDLMTELAGRMCQCRSNRKNNSDYSFPSGTLSLWLL